MHNMLILQPHKYETVGSHINGVISVSSFSVDSCRISCHALINHFGSCFCCHFLTFSACSVPGFKPVICILTALKPAFNQEKQPFTGLDLRAVACQMQRWDYGNMISWLMVKYVRWSKEKYQKFYSAFYIHSSVL